MHWLSQLGHYNAQYSRVPSRLCFFQKKKPTLKSKQTGAPEQNLLERWTTDSFQLTLVGIYQGVTYGQWPGKSARWCWVISPIKVYCRRVHLSFNSTVKKKYAEDISRLVTFRSFELRIQMDMCAAFKGHIWSNNRLLKSVNLQYNMLVRWADETNDSSTKLLMFEILFF